MAEAALTLDAFVAFDFFAELLVVAEATSAAPAAGALTFVTSSVIWGNADVVTETARSAAIAALALTAESDPFWTLSAIATGRSTLFSAICAVMPSSV